uniref:Uncharacterized protein n=1 Tax=Lactuca sativa TaxID=4236 RepID=A0A9R1WBA9_LACSA|nr:hypothetical protein LSAT_V11C300113840 [Lactuca sativa]
MRKKKPENENKNEKKLTRQKETKEIIIDMVVQTKYGQIIERAIMESLYPSIEIFGEVLDTWADLLNYQELGRDFGNSPYRLFLKVGVSINYLSNFNIV